MSFIKNYTSFSQRPCTTRGLTFNKKIKKNYIFLLSFLFFLYEKHWLTDGWTTSSVMDHRVKSVETWNHVVHYKWCTVPLKAITRARICHNFYKIKYKNFLVLYFTTPTIWKIVYYSIWKIWPLLQIWWKSTHNPSTHLFPATIVWWLSRNMVVWAAKAGGEEIWTKS